MWPPSTICDADHEPSTGPEKGLLPPSPSGMFVPDRIDRAERLDRAPFSIAISDRPTPSQRAGLSYEKRVKSRLAAHFGSVFNEGVWFSYLADGSLKRLYCQVDGLVNAAPSPIVFEIKLRWNDGAWWQLAKLYGPVAKRALLSFEMPSLVAVVRSYDPAVVVPEPIKLLRRVEECPYLGAGEVGVLVWK